MTGASCRHTPSVRGGFWCDTRAHAQQTLWTTSRPLRRRAIASTLCRAATTRLCSPALLLSSSRPRQRLQARAQFQARSGGSNLQRQARLQRRSQRHQQQQQQQQQHEHVHEHHVAAVAAVAMCDDLPASCLSRGMLTLPLSLQCALLPPPPLAWPAYLSLLILVVTCRLKECIVFSFKPPPPKKKKKKKKRKRKRKEERGWHSERGLCDGSTVRAIAEGSA